MCMFIDSEVLLANLLQYDGDSGVSYTDLENYCNRIKKQLTNEKGINCVSFRLYDYVLKSNVSRYPSMFKYYSGKYYKGEEFDLSKFNARTKKELAPILKTAAINA